MTDAHDALDREIAKEKAEALGRAGARFERALEELRELDLREREGAAAAVGTSARERLVARAAELLGHYLVQREAWGLRVSAPVFETYDVPAEVVARVGVRMRESVAGRADDAKGRHER